MTVTNNIYQKQIKYHVFNAVKSSWELMFFVYITCRIEIKFYLLTYEFRVDRTCSGIYNTFIFRRIFLSNYWWQKSDIWSQASYRYPMSWEAFFDPSDSYFLFAKERGYHRWALAHSSSCLVLNDNHSSPNKFILYIGLVVFWLRLLKLDFCNNFFLRITFSCHDENFFKGVKFYLIPTYPGFGHPYYIICILSKHLYKGLFI
jgi:hypothetical protein